MERKWYDSKFNPFANYDEPWPPKSYKPQITGITRKLNWWARNPIHNFTFHWIGVSGRVISTNGEFLSDGLKFASIKTKHLKLPLLSYRGSSFEWYIGWRFNGGFGLSLRKSNSKDASQVN